MFPEWGRTECHHVSGIQGGQILLVYRYFPIFDGFLKRLPKIVPSSGYLGAKFFPKSRPHFVPRVFQATGHPQHMSVQ
jgi:hypothetical protein